MWQTGPDRCNRDKTRKHFRMFENVRKSVSARHGRADQDQLMFFNVQLIHQSSQIVHFTDTVAQLWRCITKSLFVKAKDERKRVTNVFQLNLKTLLPGISTAWDLYPKAPNSSKVPSSSQFLDVNDASCKKSKVKFDFNSGWFTTREYVSIFYIKKWSLYASCLLLISRLYLDRKMYNAWFDTFCCCFGTFRDIQFFK